MPRRRARATACSNGPRCSARSIGSTRPTGIDEKRDQKARSSAEREVSARCRLEKVQSRRIESDPDAVAGFYGGIGFHLGGKPARGTEREVHELLGTDEL